MDEKIQLRHPLGKKPVRMPKEKYELLRSHLLKFLRAEGRATFSAMTGAIEKDFKRRKIEFQGSLPWH